MSRNCDNCGKTATMACPECEAAFYCGMQCRCKHSSVHHELCTILTENSAEKSIDGHKPKRSRFSGKPAAIKAKSKLLLALLKRNRLNVSPSGFSRGFLESGELGMSVEDANRYGTEHRIENEEEIATVLAMAIISKFLSKYRSVIPLADLRDFMVMQTDGIKFLKQRRNASDNEVRMLIKHAKRHIPATTYKIMIAPIPEAPPPVVVVQEGVDLSQHRTLLSGILRNAKSRSIDRLTKILQAMNHMLVHHAGVSFPNYSPEFMEAYNKFKTDFRRALESFEPSDYGDIWEDVSTQESFGTALYKLSKSMLESNWGAGPYLGHAVISDLLPLTLVTAVKYDYVDFSRANDPAWAIHDVVDNLAKLDFNEAFRARYVDYMRLHRFLERMLANRGAARAYEYIVE